MSHADDFIYSEWEYLKTIYPAMVQCINLSDEPSGDFGIAHAWWGEGHKCEAYLSFDRDRVPKAKTVRHELAHLLTWNASPPNPNGYGWPITEEILESFWVARGFPGTAAESDARAKELARQGLMYESWRHWALECFAECFAACNTTNDDPDYYKYEKTQDYGMPLTDEKRATMIGWFKTLEKYGEEDMTQEEFDAMFLEATKKFITPSIVAIKEEIFKVVDGMRKAGNDLNV